MKYSQVYSFYFSPVGSTARIVNRVAEGIGAALDLPVLERRFTVPSTRQPLTFDSADILVIGTPTYAGRVPNKIMPYIRDQVHGKGTIAIPIVTFGNRSVDSSLKELSLLLQENGFVVAGGGAFPCGHVFSETLGEGRPLEEDLSVAKAFGEDIGAKILGAESASGTVVDSGSGPDSAAASGNAASILSLPIIREEEIQPYYTPLKEDGTPASFLKAVPKTDPVKCYMCGTCARACPMGAIDKNNFADIIGTCIKCHACVRKCSAGAKYFDDPELLSHIRMLESNYQDRKEITLYI